MVKKKKITGGGGPTQGTAGRRASMNYEANINAAPQAAELRPDDAIVINDAVWVPPSSMRFTFTRSSGPGGQAVNKVSTRAQLRVALNEIVGLNDRARARLKRLAGQRLTADGEIIIQSDVHRSQRQNKGECENRLRELISKALIEPRKRKKTKPSKSAVQRRLTEKKRQGDKKQKRRGSVED